MTERLKIEIPLPGEDINTTQRFASAAFIKQVTLDGKHTFCGLEPVRAYLPQSGGAGICSEIKANELIEEAGIGEVFPKFGCGLLIKPDQAPYSFRRHYDYKPFPVSIRVNGNEADFHTEMRDCMGYRLSDHRTVIADKNTITILYEFENKGSRTLKLGEYCHNFIHIDRLPIGPSYYLGMTLKKSQEGVNAKEADGKIFGKGFGYSWKEYDEHPCSLFVPAEDIAEDNFHWTLTHAESSCSISEYTGFKPSKILIWSVDFNISPECYHTFTLAPGEKISYWRRWEFND